MDEDATAVLLGDHKMLRSRRGLRIGRCCRGPEAAALFRRCTARSSSKLNDMINKILSAEADKRPRTRGTIREIHSNVIDAIRVTASGEDADSEDSEWIQT